MIKVEKSPWKKKSEQWGIRVDGDPRTGTEHGGLDEDVDGAGTGKLNAREEDKARLEVVASGSAVLCQNVFIRASRGT